MKRRGLRRSQGARQSGLKGIDDLVKDKHGSGGGGEAPQGGLSDRIQGIPVEAKVQSQLAPKARQKVARGGAERS